MKYIKTSVFRINLDQITYIVEFPHGNVEIWIVGKDAPIQLMSGDESIAFLRLVDLYCVGNVVKIEEGE